MMRLERVLIGFLIPNGSHEGITHVDKTPALGTTHQFAAMVTRAAWGDC